MGYHSQAVLLHPPPALRGAVPPPAGPSGGAGLLLAVGGHRETLRSPPPQQGLPISASVGSCGRGGRRTPLANTHPTTGQAGPATRGARNRSGAAGETYSGDDRPQRATSWVLAAAAGRGGGGADVSAPPGSQPQRGPGRKGCAPGAGRGEERAGALARAGYRWRLASASRSPRRGLRVSATHGAPPGASLGKGRASPRLRRRGRRRAGR